MFLSKALSLPSSELALVQDILDEALSMHSDVDAIRAQALDVLQLNLQQPVEIVNERFSGVVDQLLAHIAVPTEVLLLAVAIIREAGFDDLVEPFQLAIFDRNSLSRSTPALELYLREKFDRYPSASAAELSSHNAVWRALEHLTKNTGTS